MGHIKEEYAFDGKVYIRVDDYYMIYYGAFPLSFSVDIDRDLLTIQSSFSKEEIKWVSRGEFYDTLKREIKEHCNFEKMQRIINND